MINWILGGIIVGLTFFVFARVLVKLYRGERTCSCGDCGAKGKCGLQASCEEKNFKQSLRMIINLVGQLSLRHKEHLYAGGKMFCVSWFC